MNEVYDETKSNPSMGIMVLLEGKTDSELLQSLVNALTDHDNYLLKNLSNLQYPSESDKGNIQVVKSICRYVNEQGDDDAK